jgi:hypothetical protein
MANEFEKALDEAAKAHDQAAWDRQFNFLHYDLAYVPVPTPAFVEGANWARDFERKRAEGLVEALNKIESLTHSWVIAQETIDCKHTYEEIRNAKKQALATYQGTEKEGSCLTK